MQVLEMTVNSRLLQWGAPSSSGSKRFRVNGDYVWGVVGPKAYP